MKKIIAIVIFTNCFLSAFSTENVEDLYLKGNLSYEKGDYSDAIIQYEQVLDSNIHSFDLYFHLANSYYLNGNVPYSILNYERALKINPNDEKCLKNIRIANSRIKEIKAIPKLFYIRWFSNINNSLKINQWAIICVLAIWATTTLFFFYIKNKTKVNFYGVLLFFVSSCFTLLNYNSALNKSKQLEIIFTHQTFIYTSQNSLQQEYKIDAGNKALILINNDEYIKVKLKDGNVGWVKNEKFVII